MISIAIALLAIPSLLPAPADASDLPADATTQKLGIITNDLDPSVSTMNVALDPARQVEGIYIETDKHDAEPPTMTHEFYPTRDIESSDGVTLDGDATHRAVILQGPIDSKQGRADLVVTYLYNGITGSYRQCQVKMSRSSQDEWSLVNAYTGQVIQEIRTLTWSMFGQTLGISTIQNVCPQASRARPGFSSESGPR